MSYSWLCRDQIFIFGLVPFNHLLGSHSYTVRQNNFGMIYSRKKNSSSGWHISWCINKVIILLFIWLTLSARPPLYRLEQWSSQIKLSYLSVFWENHHKKKQFKNYFVLVEHLQFRKIFFSSGPIFVRKWFLTYKLACWNIKITYNHILIIQF